LVVLFIETTAPVTRLGAAVDQRNSNLGGFSLPQPTRFRV